MGRARLRRPDFQQPWPCFDEELARRALADAKVKPYVDRKQVAKVIIVPDKLVNIVVKG